VWDMKSTTVFRSKISYTEGCKYEACAVWELYKT
jgi:hypothetical protein